ncbi:MAG: hypothetical protein RL272_1021, partial [Candidatus Parcubacteria bacterium]
MVIEDFLSSYLKVLDPSSHHFVFSVKGTMVLLPYLED